MYNYTTQKKMWNHKHVDTQTKLNTCRQNSKCRHDTDTNVEPRNKKGTTTQPIKKNVEPQTCRHVDKTKHMQTKQ